MSIRTNSNYEEEADEGNAELTLALLTYVGSRSMYHRETMRSQGGYPSLDGFQQGESKLVRLPSDRLGYWESHADFEVAYDEVSMAEAMLDNNYIPSPLVGPNYNPDRRDELVEKLGLEQAPQGDEGWRTALRDVAGIEAEADDGELPEGGSDPRAESLQSTDRSVLIKVAGSYEDVDDLTEEAGVNSVSHLEQTALAEFLAGKDDDEIDRRIATAEQGGEV
jgi:hypothetical protein